MRKHRIIEWIPLYPDVVVWINVAKLDASWKHDASYYVDAHAAGLRNAMPTRYKKFEEWFALGHRVWMPDIGLTDSHVSFSDGRHRFAWLRDHGVGTLPVTVSPDMAAEVKRRFGTRSRTSRLPRKSRAHDAH